ncbi:MAG TPA: hypothetical protein VLJ41_01990, partial [Segetibacter sp.]|nr:hypothetical protein [Segetibacter sp.]
MRPCVECHASLTNHRAAKGAYVAISLFNHVRSLVLPLLCVPHQQHFVQKYLKVKNRFKGERGKSTYT